MGEASEVLLLEHLSHWDRTQKLLMSLANRMYSIFKRFSEASLPQKTVLDEQGTFKVVMSTAQVLTRSC